MACGFPLEPGLARLASARCHDCRDLDSPFDPALVATGGLAALPDEPAGSLIATPAD
jgi:hypothetical protein